MRVRILRAELWGNLKDGFDNNQNLQIAKFDTDKQLSEKLVLKMAREYFAGYSFALSENSTTFIGKNSKCIAVEQSSNYDDVIVYDVTYRHQYIGEIRIDLSLD